MKALVIAAHPDDEVLGCGGTLARLASEGATISILILAQGLMSRPGADPKKSKKLLDLHYERAREAGRILGAKEVNLVGFPDQRMDTLPLLEITQTIEKEIARVEPDTVFTHHGGDLNMDHVITFRATLTATRPVAGCGVRTVYAYEVPSSSEWSFQQFAPVFQPNIFVNIEPTLDLKVRAMQTYESEARPFPHPRSPEALRAVAHRWGTVVGISAAEAFHCVRDVR